MWNKLCIFCIASVGAFLFPFDSAEAARRCTSPDDYEKYQCYMVRAIELHDTETIKKLLATIFVSPNDQVRLCSPRSYLGCALKSGGGQTKEIVSILLDAGADPMIYGGLVVVSVQDPAVFRVFIDHGLKGDSPVGFYWNNGTILLQAWAMGCKVADSKDTRRVEMFKMLWAATLDPGHVNDDGQHIGFYIISNWYPNANCRKVFDYIFTQRPDLLQKADASDLRPIEYASITPVKDNLRRCYKNAREYPTRPQLRKLLLDAGSSPPGELKGTFPCAWGIWHPG